MSFTTSHTATHCNTLQHTETYCNTPQHTATRCAEANEFYDERELKGDPILVPYPLNFLGEVTHTATNCSTLQHAKEHYNTLQHTATGATTQRGS